jgi:hypothetical protein
MSKSKQMPHSSDAMDIAIAQQQQKTVLPKVLPAPRGRAARRLTAQSHILNLFAILTLHGTRKLCPARNVSVVSVTTHMTSTATRR